MTATTAHAYPPVLRPLFLNPPTFDGFDGGAGARYQASREVTSFWYPTWLCYPAAMIEGSRVVDAPVQKLSLENCIELCREYNVVVVYTSTPTLQMDIATLRQIKQRHPGIITVLTGPHVTVQPDETLAAGTGAVDIVCRGEFDYTIKEICDGKDWKGIDGISFSQKEGTVHNLNRPLVTDLDALPFVASVYRRDLPIKDYVIPHFKSPYVMIYSSRGCPANCIFCLWPQTFTGRQLRTRSPGNVFEEVRWISNNIPEMRELAFDDDNFTANRHHATEIARLIKPLRLSWTINSRADCDFETLRIMRDAGLRHVVVGFESGNDDILRTIRKGISKEQAIAFVKNCKRLGLSVHGAFVMGLPGETRATINETIECAIKMDLNSVQASIATPYPGTEFYNLCREHGWITSEQLLDANGHQKCVLNYPHLSNIEIFKSVGEFYSRFYFRPLYILRSIGRMLADRHECRKKLKEGKQYLNYMRERKKLTSHGIFWAAHLLQEAANLC